MIFSSAIVFPRLNIYIVGLRYLDGRPLRSKTPVVALVAHARANLRDNVIQNLLLTPVYYLNWIKTNITHTPGDRMVSAIENLCVGYYDAI